MATADLGAIETCGLPSFSPLIDLLRACSKRKVLATVSDEAMESRAKLELERGMTGQAAFVKCGQRATAISQKRGEHGKSCGSRQKVAEGIGEERAGFNGVPSS